MIQLRTPFITLLFAASAVVTGCGKPEPTPPATQPSATTEATGTGFVVRNARVFDGEHDRGITTVVVRDGVITSVGDDSQAPSDLAVIDGTGKTLLPGLIDAHVHAWGDAQRDMARFGVTSALDMHGVAERLPALRAQRESLADTGQADLWASGYAITAPRGHGTQYGFPVPAVDADTDVDAFIGARVDEGADYIKLIIEDLGAYRSARTLPTLSPEQVQSVVTAAQARNRLAVAHVSALRDAHTAIDAGADGLVHVFVDAVADDALVADMRQRDAFIIPTLSVVAAFAGRGQGDQLAADAQLQSLLSAEQRTSLTADVNALGARGERLDHAIDSVRKLHAAGVAILAGTDAPNPGTAHGISMHGELEWLVQAGLTPAQALTAATALPAKRFGLTGRGHIAKGSRADLILVDGNPLDDIAATRQIDTVWKNGHVVERKPASAAPASTAAAAPASGQALVSDFDQGTVSASFGSWLETTDQMAGGASVVSHQVADGGADGSTGALTIAGEIKAGFGFPWSGMMFFPAAQPMEPVDLSARKELVFQVRGDGRTYNAMLFSGPSVQGMPSTQTFVAGPEWTQVRLPLTAFPGAELTQVRGIAFTAGQPLGTFEFRIDHVELSLAAE